MPQTPSLKRSLAVVGIGIAGALLVLYAWRLPPFGSDVQTTENAYVRGQVTVISPQVAGYIVDVPARDFQAVKAGDVLVRVDRRIFEQKVKQAEAALAVQKANFANADQQQKSAEARIRAGEAQLVGAKAALETAEANAKRIGTLLERGVSTQSTADQTRAALEEARAAESQAEGNLDVARQDLQTIIVNRLSLEASIASAEAQIRLAQIDLDNTEIRAPQDGRLGEVGAHPGQYVTPGTQLLALVSHQKWILANFKESQLFGSREGQPVSFTVDAFRHARLTGHIEHFSPATVSEFSVLKADNATGNFIKVAQRMPVKIAIDPGQPLAEDLAPGMSVVVRLDTALPAEGVGSRSR